jgi:light-regulated signal transduction histidine kinase (bacteriophytochrome)
MREYLARLLATRWQVEVVGDGAAALASARAQPPDLVLSDVMMPGLDGFGLLRALRAHAETSQIPVVLLSARAGEEALLEGLETGADDYLVKPFAARELLARVQTHLDLARLRREWSGELERANNELEAFSYSVSHDLRAPLRHISGFADMLRRHAGSSLDETSRRHLDTITKSSKRMGDLIDDLLVFSRMGRAAMGRARVPLGPVVAEVLGEIQEDVKGRKIDWKIDPLPEVQGDPAMLRQVLANLISNAVKYTRTRPEARIEIGAQSANGDTVVFVRDNGVGFDAQYAHKLFGVFQRLHSEKDFEGTGAGLAIVQRIVARHGGRAWADGEVGKGATFYFTLGGEALAAAA